MSEQIKELTQIFELFDCVYDFSLEKIILKNVFSIFPKLVACLMSFEQLGA